MLGDSAMIGDTTVLKFKIKIYHQNCYIWLLFRMTLAINPLAAIQLAIITDACQFNENRCKQNKNSELLKFTLFSNKIRRKNQKLR